MYVILLLIKRNVYELTNFCARIHVDNTDAQTHHPSRYVFQRKESYCTYFQTILKVNSRRLLWLQKNTLIAFDSVECIFFVFRNCYLRKPEDRLVYKTNYSKLFVFVKNVRIKGTPLDPCCGAFNAWNEFKSEKSSWIWLIKCNHTLAIFLWRDLDDEMWLKSRHIFNC